MRNARPRLDRNAAIIGLATVIAANFLYLAGLPLILDPMMSMEPFYIHMAALPVSSILREDPAFGPLYALWLKPFVAVLDDPIAVYTANLYALSIGVSAAIYVYLLLLTRRPAAAAGAALFFLISDFNVPLSSKVSAFALLVVLVSMALSELAPTGARRMSVTAVGVLLASYARPELYPAALCLCLTAAWLAFREHRQSGWNVVYWPVSALGAIVVSALPSGTPLFRPQQGDDRFLIAFREHFAWNWSVWHQQWRYFRSIWEEEFGTAQTPLQAFLNNPRAVAHHLLDNFLGTLRFMVASTFDHYPLLAPATVPDLVKTESLLFSLAVLGSLIIVVSRPAWRRQMIERYGHALYVYAILMAISFASATAIFPLAHYLVIPGVLLILTGTLALTLMIPVAPGPRSLRIRILAGLVCLMVIPRPFVLPTYYDVPGSPFKARLVVTRTIVDTVEFIRSLGLTPPVQVLTLTDGIGDMLGPGFREIKVWQKGDEPLEDYIHDNNIAMIVSLQAGHDNFLFSDPYWQVLLNTPETTGFTRLSVPNHENVVVCVRTDLMPQ